jgi:phosphohistidine phosphatase
MQLYLIRHGIAAARGPQYPDDSQRPLTRAGEARMRLEADALGVLDIAFDLILTSPLLRATQTAAIVAAGRGTRTATPVTESEALACNGTPDDVWSLLAGHADSDAIALVGHEPNLGDLVGTLIGAGTPMRFKKGAICRIDVPLDGPLEGTRDRTRLGELRWFLPPRVLRAIGRG